MSSELGDLGRFAGPATLILSSLAQGPKHGYAITKDVEAFAGVKLQPGTLYGALGRLEHDGLIEPLADDGRRRPYGITPRGARALETQLTAQRRVTEVGLRRLSTGLVPS
jgi:DNA-binding PadR family transcriptional regulator